MSIALATELTLTLCFVNGLYAMNTSTLCPACGALNDCSMAAPQTDNPPCWCYGVSINPNVLEALPAELRNVACLCPRCAQVERQLQSARGEQLT